MTTERELRRRAGDLFTLVWSLLEKDERSPEEDETMVNAAHASRFYFGEAGTAVNWARGEWQLARVYAVLGRPEPALHHARRCLETCLEHAAELEPWDLPYAYEALARAHALGGDRDRSGHYAALARETAERVDDADDRERLLADVDAVSPV